MLLLPMAGRAAESRIKTTGACDFGPSTYTFVVSQFDATTLRVRVVITGGAPSQSWAMFMTDNGEKVIRNVKVSALDGSVRWARKTPDRLGLDLVEMAASNRDSGEICTRTISY
jgi:hypothetical protein